MVHESDCVACSDDVVYADEGGAEAVGDKRRVVLTDLCVFLHWFCFHVAVANFRAWWWCWADVFFPWCAQ